MRVEVVHTGGRYAERVISYFSSVSPGSVDAYLVPESLPTMLEDAAEALPTELGSGDVVIALNIPPDLLLAIPLAVGGAATLLIAPAEDPSWVRPNFQRQVARPAATTASSPPSPGPSAPSPRPRPC